MGVDLIFKIASIGILTTVVVQILKKSDRDDIATLVTLTAVVLVLGIVVGEIAKLFQTLKEIFALY